MMRLIRALRIEPGRALALVGAGGKTSAMRRMLEELATSALVVTTTHLGREQADLADLHWGQAGDSATDPHSAPDLVETLRSGKSVLLTGPLNDAGDKWTGAAADWSVGTIARRAEVPLLVEADGARQRSLKAPADHEPALPTGVWGLTVVPIAGLDVLGQPLNSTLVHRPERVASVLGVDPETAIGPAEVAAVLGSDRGGLKGVPGSANVRVLLTKATPERMPAAREIATLLLDNDRIDSVSIADLTAEDPVLETHGRVAGVVLAAGGSARLGEPKQLIEWRGRPLVWHAVRAALDAGLSPVVVVTGRAGDRVGQALAGEPVMLFDNPDWEAGQSLSVLSGMAALASVREVEAVVMLLADMPFVDAELVRAVVERHSHTYAPLVAPYAGGRRANPVLFDRVTFGDLQRLEGDQGGRALFDKFEHETVEWDEAITFDLDTPQDLERLRQLE